MYTPLNLMADYVAINQRRLRFRDRWKTASGQSLHTKLLDAITTGNANKLQAVMKTKQKFFEGAFDLRGLRIVDCTIKHLDNQLFRNATLNYSRFRDVKIERTALISSSGNFVTAVRTSFEKVTFERANWFGASFEDCVFSDCNFIDRNVFSNCSFKNVVFENCYFETDIFTDCLFDEQTKLVGTKPRSHRFTYYEVPLQKYDKKYASSFYSGVRQAYEAGQVSTLARKFRFKEKQAFTRYNTDSLSQKLARYALEITNGYGIKPLRVLMTALVTFAVFSIFFMLHFGSDGFLLSAGGYFTFGADTGLLDVSSFGYHLLYVFEAFLGIINMSTFIVVMTNYWSSLR